MDSVLKLSELERHYTRFIAALESEKQISKAAAKVLEICAVKQRRATQITKELLDAGIARSETTYGPLRLNITAEMSAALFPTLA